MASAAMASESDYNPGLEEIADRAANRLAELTQQYCGEGRTCSCCTQFKPWNQFRKKWSGKNGRHTTCNTCKNKYQRDKYHGVTRVVPEQPTTHKCRGKCGRTLPFDDQHFSKHPPSHWGRLMTCRTCVNGNTKVVKKLKKENPKTDADGRCFACNKQTDQLVLDHDHDTDAFRGWACRSCNRRLCAPYSGR